MGFAGSSKTCKYVPDQCHGPLKFFEIILESKGIVLFVLARIDRQTGKQATKESKMSLKNAQTFFVFSEIKFGTTPCLRGNILRNNVAEIMLQRLWASAVIHTDRQRFRHVLT